jgi:predicted transcriptional regulator
VIKMADETLTPNAKKVYEAMKKLGATSEDKLKTADDIMKAASMGKGLVNNALQELINKGYVKRIARQKSAGYYLLK